MKYIVEPTKNYTEGYCFCIGKVDCAGKCSDFCVANCPANCLGNCPGNCVGNLVVSCPTYYTGGGGYK